MSITLTGSDGDGDDLTYTVVRQPESGTLRGTAPDSDLQPQGQLFREVTVLSIRPVTEQAGFENGYDND